MLLVGENLEAETPTDWEGNVTFGYTYVSLISYYLYSIASTESAEVFSLIIGTNFDDWSVIANSTEYSIGTAFIIEIDGTTYHSQTNKTALVNLCSSRNGETTYAKFWFA